jgi:sec-independent protein translocase protein TatA
MGMPSMPELIIILVIIVLLFGAKKIPDLAQGLGKGIKNFKKAMSEEDKAEENNKVENTKESKVDISKTEIIEDSNKTDSK